MGGRIIPERITKLSKCEIFVFGSNLQGQHYGGAARMAYENFGAEWGVGAGRTGQSYAIPTMHGGINDIKPYVDEFTEYVKAHPDNRFLVTRIGCGIAGFNDEDIAPLFKEAFKLPNVNVSEEWIIILTADEFTDAVLFGILPDEVSVPVPKAISEDDLISLSKKYRYIIGAHVKAPLQKIKVRYIIDNNIFGYATFGEFILTDEGEMYVFSKNQVFANGHDQDMVESFFGDECEGRGFLHRVLFAGVETPFVDCNGDKIYTGDVIDVNDGEFVLALSTLGSNHQEGTYKKQYAFVLDNHSLFPEECKKMRRVGTVFYQLDKNDSLTVNARCRIFQGCHPGGLPLEDKLIMAKFTPNFDKEQWKYQGHELLGIKEYNWRK